MAFSPHYYKNLCGMKVSRDNMEHIPLPRLELTQHVTLKTTQAFGLIGAGVIAPIMTLVRPQRESKLQELQDNAFKYGKNGILAGLVAGPLITAAFLPGKTYEGVYDRCFSIRHNKGQTNVDRFSILGLAVGVGLCQFVGERLDKGAVLGYVGGFVLGAAVNRLMC